MSASLNNIQYPFFETIELNIENDYQPAAYKALKPVVTGDYIPDFTLQHYNGRWQQFFNGAEIHGPVLLRQLLSRPLVLAFYHRAWNSHGEDYLKQLNKIQYEVKANGGNLLVISTEKESGLEKLVWEQGLSLSFYFDPENEIAKKFGIFSEDSPIWNLFSGIDQNVPLLATYVLSVGSEVLFHHIELDFATTFPSRDLEEAVYKAALMGRQKTA